MKKFFLIPLISLFIMGCSNPYSTIEDQNKKISDLNIKIENLEKNNLDAQEKCAKQADKTFTSLGYESKGTDSFENHYSQKLNKCFIEIISTNFPHQNKMLFDAFEGKSYGNYSWNTEKDKKYWCTILDKNCNSEVEFDNFVKTYMEN